MITVRTRRIGGGRHYVIVAMTHHAKGDNYLVEFAAAVADLLVR